MARVTNARLEALIVELQAALEVERERTDALAERIRDLELAQAERELTNEPERAAWTSASPEPTRSGSFTFKVAHKNAAMRSRRGEKVRVERIENTDSFRVVAY